LSAVKLRYIIFSTPNRDESLNMKPSNKEDSSDSKSNSTSVWKTESSILLRKSDLLAALIACVVIVLCLAAALISYFLLQANEVFAAQDGLQKIKGYSIVAYQRALDATLQSVMSANSLFNTSETTVDMYKQFIPLMYANNNQFPQYIFSVSYVEKVVNKTAFEQENRAKGGEYTNFTVTGRDASNNPVPAKDAPYYFVIMQTVPTASHLSILGLALNDDLIKNQSISCVLRTRKPCATGRILLGNNNGSGSALFTPLFNQTTGEIVGTMNGAIVLSDLTATVLQGIAQDLVVVLYDMNSTTNGGFVFSTNAVNSVYDGAPETTALIQKAPFISDGYMTFADRTLRLVLVPTTQFMNSYVVSQKVIAITVSMVFMIVGLSAAFIIGVALRMQQVKREKQKARQKFESMKANQSIICEKLSIIADSEKKLQLVVNNIDQFVATVSASGAIIYTNDIFDRIFKYSPMDYEKGLLINSVVGMNVEVCAAMKEETKVSTVSKDYEKLEVLVQFKHIRNDAEQGSMEVDANKESYILLGRLITIKS
jgi:CHASE1-domain containing sensor protein